MSSDRERAKTLELAEKYAKKGKLQDAINEYRKLISGSAQDINIRNIIADLYLKMEYKAKAIEELTIMASFYDERGLHSQSMAIYKKINKLAPENIDATRKLADIYFNQGFFSEAKAEYLKVARELKKYNRTRDAIALYEKILKLDKRDVPAKLTLAELYTKERLIDQAVELLNEVAEFKIRSNALKEAREILLEARKLKEDHWRTLANLIDLLRREDKKKEALNLVNDILKKDSNNIKALKILGNFYFEDQDFEKAEEAFSKIISLRPKDVEARVKLGRINIYQDNLDHAYELFEPLIEILIKKQKIEKAIGLLGLILSSKRVHIPTLEKLVLIYKSTNQNEKLEVACRVLLEEYYKGNLLTEALPILKELVELCPQDEELIYEYSRLREEFGLPGERVKPEGRAEEAEKVEAPPEVEEPAVEKEKVDEFLEEKEEVAKTVEEERETEIPAVEEKVVKEPVVEEKEPQVFSGVEIKTEEPAEVEEEKEEALPEERVPEERPSGFEEGSPEMLEMNLAQADLYIEQGLIRNARRILENLRTQFPDEPRIEEKLFAIRDVTSTVRVDEILERVAKVSKKETKLFRKKTDFEKGEEEKLSAADIFGETEVSPDASERIEKKRYYDSAARIEEELEAINAIFNLQLKGNTTAVEKGLEDIVAQFRKGVEKNIDKKDHESHFNLGIAFLEQDLLDDAIEELKLASLDERPSVECYSLISNCYRKKKYFKEAANWLEKALELCEEGSSQYFAIKYELASCYEELKETEKALALYDEIKNWDSDYRDVAKKIKILHKSL